MTSLCSNYLETSYIKKNNNIISLDHKNRKYFVSKEKIYLLSATESLNTIKSEPALSSEESDFFLETCLQFYIELVSQIKKRFVFEDELFNLIDILDPPTAHAFETKSLVPVIDFQFYKSM